jgi:hypothetical protein
MLRHLRWVALTALLAAALVGCGGHSRTSGADAAHHGSSTATSSAEPSPSARAARSNDALLPASEVGSAAGGTWTQHPAKARGTAIGACNLADMGSIGAASTVRRDYRSGALTAANEVARLPDQMTARRALKVLESFRTMCDQHPGRLTAVSLDGGTGWWYVSGSDPRADGFGVAAIGTRFSLVALHGGTRAKLAPAMPALVTAAAARIG